MRQDGKDVGMILVIGGYAQGKRAWVERNLGFGPEVCSSELGTDASVLFDVQDLAEQVNADDLAGYRVIICNEVGCGIVPVRSEDRRWREAVGHLCCQLAQRAMCVVRVHCGIGIVIKGELA